MEFDKDRDGELEPSELCEALSKGNIHYNKTDTDLMIRAFDRSGNRRLNFDEFKDLATFLHKVQDSFNSVSCTKSFRDGEIHFLTFDEVNVALTNSGVHLVPEALQAMCRRYDSDRSETITLDEFIRLFLFVSSCLLTFKAYDLEKKGQIVLSFSEFVYAGSNLC
uniref:EF-hand domain-containing protein n=1 Tax=Polytomella parva TaxID=51329 RepID=A0A7S0UN56_9CHLO